MSSEERIDHPAHYGGAGRFEVIEVIEDWDLGFKAGNALKYLYRAGKKRDVDPLEDLKKAHWYLKRCREKAALSSELFDRCEGQSLTVHCIGHEVGGRAGHLELEEVLGAWMLSDDVSDVVSDLFAGRWHAAETRLLTLIERTKLAVS